MKNSIAILVLLCTYITGGQVILPTAVPAPKRLELHWDSQESKFHVFEGTNRLNWQTNYFTTNSSLALEKGRHYGVAAVGVNGTESSLALWPSNVVYKVVVQTNTSIPGSFKDAFVLSTNITVEPPQMYLRIRQELSHYE